MKRFLLADDNPDLRSALRLMLETRLRSLLIFEATYHATLIDQSIAHQPDCPILDWELPGFKNHPCLDTLRDLLPDLKIILPAPIRKPLERRLLRTPMPSSVRWIPRQKS
jgi:CheY-like chemotaxis protein